MTAKMKHCAADGCMRLIDRRYVACIRHWWLVSQATRDRVEYEREHDPHSVSYLDAVDQAIWEINK